MEITASMVKELRQATGAGVLDCRKALESTAGDVERATEILREKGLSTAAKKSSREVKEGLIGHYVHTGSKVAALVEVDCESDFVARTAEFQTLTRDLAMQVVAARPRWVRPEDVPADVLETEKQAYEGKLSKFYEEHCLLEQPFIKDNNKRIKDVITETVAKLGENIVVRQFARLEVGD